jgi:hypothetical protein
MEENNVQMGSSDPNIMGIFDQTLLRHMERLLGTGYGIAGLTMNLFSITTLVLLSGQARDEMNRLSSPGECTTRESVLTELAEMGLKPDGNLDLTLQEMIQKGYIHLDDGKIIADKPAFSMSRLLDRLFPKMPGMNLVAYFIQTMDEVLSGRKGLEAAISQFDQTLNLQGVPLKKVPNQPVHGKEAGTRSDSTQKKMRQGAQRDQPSTSKVISFTSPRPPSESRIITSQRDSGQLEVREIDLKSISPWQDLAPEPSTQGEEPIKAQEAQNPELHATPSPEGQEAFSGATVPIPDEPLAETSSEPGVGEEDDVGAAQETGVMEGLVPEGNQGQPVLFEQPLPEPEREDETEPLSEENADTFNEENIERRIAEFQEALSMQCPLCRIGKIQEEKTEKDKVYYKCTHKACHFISWGKPYHLPCPQCSNPFLVETPGKEGRTLLKCPRATCQYWQTLPSDPGEDVQQKLPLSADPASRAASVSEGSRKRVVRRRVVRRKR